MMLEKPRFENAWRKKIIETPENKKLTDSAVKKAKGSRRKFEKSDDSLVWTLKFFGWTSSFAGNHYSIEPIYCLQIWMNLSKKNSWIWKSNFELVH